jgi:hypothetical protein
MQPTIKQENYKQNKRIIDLTGQKFNMLTVIKFSHADKEAWWECKCDCGKIKTLRARNIKSGLIKSCGCFNIEKIMDRNIKHNLCGTKTYTTWLNMIKRCTDPNNNSYKNYGARGIKLCDKWLTFKGFYEDMGDRPNETTLDRIDNDGNYLKENCKWSTKKEQANNRRNSRIITYKNKTQTLQQWADELGINVKKLWNRLFTLKWTVEKTFTKRGK